MLLTLTQRTTHFNQLLTGYQYAPDPDSADYCSSGKAYHLCRRRLWNRYRIKTGVSKELSIQVQSKHPIQALLSPPAEYYSNSVTRGYSQTMNIMSVLFSNPAPFVGVSG